MQERRDSKQIDLLNKSLLKEAERLRKEARGIPPGVARDRLIRRARMAETAGHMTEWLKSTGLKPPT